MNGIDVFLGEDHGKDWCEAREAKAFKFKGELSSKTLFRNERINDKHPL